MGNDAKRDGRHRADVVREALVEATLVAHEDAGTRRRPSVRSRRTPQCARWVLSNAPNARNDVDSVIGETSGCRLAEDRSGHFRIRSSDSANRTYSVRCVIPSFCWIRCLYVSIVLGLIPSCCPISTPL